MFIGSYPIQTGGSAIYQPIGGGKLSAGLYLSDINGNQTYFGSGTSYTGRTFNSSYPVYWFEADGEGNETTPVLIGTYPLIAGANTPIPIVGTGTYPAISLVMYLATSIVIDPTRDGDFTFLQSDIGNTSKISGTISGGAWNDTLPSALTNERIDATYVGTFTPPEGDYGHVYTQIDPNGAETSSTAVTIRWAPHTFLKTIDSNANMRDAQPDVSGIESFNVEYVKGYNVLTDGNVPQYDVNGELQTLDGGQDLLVSYGVDPSVNDIEITGVTDDFGNTKDTDTKEVTRIPALRYDGLTTVDEETYGTSYDAALSLIVDEGLSNETTVTPDEAPYDDFIGQPNPEYRDYNYTASYSYPTGESNSVPVVITYKAVASEAITSLRIDDGLIADLKFAPYYETIPDTTLTPKADTQGGVTINLSGSGTDRLIYELDLPHENAPATSRRFYNGATTHQVAKREQGTFTPQPAIRYEVSYNGTDDLVKVTGSENWMPLNSDWTYHLTDNETTLSVGTLINKGIRGDGDETYIDTDALGVMTLVFGGVTVGAIGTLSADVHAFITLKYVSSAQDLTVWYDSEVVIDAFDVSTAQTNTRPIVLHCHETAVDTYSGFTDGNSHHHRYYSKVFDNRNKDAFFSNVHFSIMLPQVGDSFMASVGATKYDKDGQSMMLDAYYRRTQYGDGDDIYIVPSAVGGNTFYQVSRPDDYDVPVYVVGIRPDLNLQTGVAYCMSNVTYWVDRCMCDIYMRVDTQNWAGLGYNEGPQLYSEYIDALDAEIAVCDSFSAKIVFGSPVQAFEEVASPTEHQTVDSTYNYIKANYSIDKLNDHYSYDYDELIKYRYQKLTDDLNGSAAVANADGIINYNFWDKALNQSHPNSYLYYQYAMNWVQKFDQYLEIYRPVNTSPLADVALRFNMSDLAAIEYRDQPSGSIENLTGQGSETYGKLIASRLDADLFLTDIGNGVMTLECRGDGGFGEILNDTLGLWNGEEYTISVLFTRGATINDQTDDVPDGQDHNTTRILSTDESDGLSLQAAGASGVYAKSASSTYSVGNFIAGEVIRVTYVAYKDESLNLRVRAYSQRLYDVGYNDFTRSAQLAQGTSLAVFARQNDPREYEGAGKSKAQILDISVWDRALTGYEAKYLEYEATTTLPVLSTEEYQYYDANDYTSTPVTAKSGVVYNSWQTDAIVNDEIVDNSGRNNWVLPNANFITQRGGYMQTVDGGNITLGDDGLYHFLPWCAWSYAFRFYCDGANTFSGHELIDMGWWKIRTFANDLDTWTNDDFLVDKKTNVEATDIVITYNPYNKDMELWLDGVSLGTQNDPYNDTLTKIAPQKGSRKNYTYLEEEYVNGVIDQAWVNARMASLPPI